MSTEKPKPKRRQVNLDQRGEKNPRAVLTEDDVRKIREDYRDNCEVAWEYGVSNQTISNIRLRKTWKHVD